MHDSLWVRLSMVLALAQCCKPCRIELPSMIRLVVIASKRRMGTCTGFWVLISRGIQRWCNAAHCVALSCACLCNVSVLTIGVFLSKKRSLFPETTITPLVLLRAQNVPALPCLSGTSPCSFFKQLMFPHGPKVTLRAGFNIPPVKGDPLFKPKRTLK